MQANIMVLTHWSFNDALVQTYTLPYVQLIRQSLGKRYKIILVTSEQERLALTPGEVAAINLDWQKQNMSLVAQPYERFGLKKLFRSGKELMHLYRLIKKEKIETIHAFCTPAGSLGYLLSKMTGARLVIDSFEPHAEAMVENNTWTREGLPYRLLNFLEKQQTKRASALIATTAGMKKYAQARFGVEPPLFFVKPACVDLSKFQPTGKDAQLLKELKLENKVVCVYAGKLGGIYLKEEVFDFIKACYQLWGDRFRFLMLTNAPSEEIEVEVERIGLSREVVINRFVLHQEIPAYLSLGDFALNPVKPVPTKRYCTSIKDGEYWAMGLPVVITRDISDDSAIIEENGIGYVLKEITEAEYKRAVEQIAVLLAGSRKDLQQKIREVAERYRSFAIAEIIYRSLYTR